MLVAIWVDQKEANLYKFTATGIKKEHFKGSFPDHHNTAHDRIDDQKHEHAVFKTLMPSISGAVQILILGPGAAKTHLKHFIENEAPVLSKNIVGCETTDHPTEPQLMSLASRFFNTEHLK